MEQDIETLAQWLGWYGYAMTKVLTTVWEGVA